MLRTQLSQCTKRLAANSSTTRPFSTLTPRASRTALASSRRSLGITSYNAVSSQRRRYAVAAEETNKGVDPSDSFLSGNTANYVDEMYMSWKRDPSSVHISWQAYFKNMESGDVPISRAFQAPPTLMPQVGGSGVSISATPGPGMETGGGDVSIHLKAQLLVRAYQARGHHKAHIDPLNIRNQGQNFWYSNPKELDPKHY
ncbi:2-oxoglutarate dehydrogenase E1 component, partial [Teratosphaeriaceae sp. CCFEE 6253]